MLADKTFPVTEKTTVTLSCNVGHQLKGDKVVTCTKNEEFQYSTEPICGE